ncbi:MAG: winged helix-turn-helix domain-containing protein [Dokdonella sp.]
MQIADSPVYAFSEFRLDAVKRQLLRRDGSPVGLQPKAFETLLYLVQRSERVLGKDEMIAAIWPGRVVEENNLNQNISVLRRLLSANSTDQRYIVTEPGRGYRFVAHVTSLSDEMPEVRAATHSHYTSNADAYRLYLFARHRAEKVKSDDLYAAIGFYRQSLDLDPANALAYAGMGEAYRRLPMAGDAAPNDTFPLAKAAARKAIEIDDDLAEAHSVLGWVAFWYDWNWPDSERQFRRAIKLDPNLAEARLGYAHLLSNMERNAEALEQGRKAVELNPLSPLINTIVAGFASSAGQLDEYHRLLARALHLDPDFWIAHLFLGTAALGQQRHDDAVVELNKARNSSGGSLQVMPILAVALARAGHDANARAILDDMLQRSQQGYVPPISIAKVYLVLGDRDQALLWLARGYEARDVGISFLQRDHSWDVLRADPRFVAIADQVGLR